MLQGPPQGVCLWIPRRSGYRNRLYTTCRHDRNDKFTKANKTPRKPTVTFARACARQDTHGMHKPARPLTELAGAHPRHAELPPRSHRAHRPAPPPEAAPGRRGTPYEEKVPRVLGHHLLHTRATAGIKNVGQTPSGTVQGTWEGCGAHLYTARRPARSSDGSWRRACLLYTSPSPRDS